MTWLSEVDKQEWKRALPELSVVAIVAIVSEEIDHLSGINATVLGSLVGVILLVLFWRMFKFKAKDFR